MNPVMYTLDNLHLFVILISTTNFFAQVDAMKHTLAKYLMELTIVEYDLVQYLPSQIAAAALCLSMKVLDSSQWVSTALSVPIGV